VPRWLPRILNRIRYLAVHRRVHFTLKALRELGELDLGLDEEDVCDCLAALTAEESAGRLLSSVTREWMYIFASSLGGTPLYVKLIVRDDCIVVSFHEDQFDA
jgi:hypothetical protein